MLRRVENVQVSHRPGWFSSKGPIQLQIGRQVHRTYLKVHRSEFSAMLTGSNSYPVDFGRVGERVYWLFQDRWHWDNDGLLPDQVYALLVTRDQRAHQRINRAQTIVAMQRQPSASLRTGIPDDLKQLIWTRDRGCCRQCGANVELQFDHIIPVAYGGASTAENLQVLCGPCNRSKGASVV